ncbi:hypothetical protein [Enterococcus sp. AZ180]|uniref:hypothetical protein n=1 Tax=Enterococcus sp. AZ180 TaxID=2774961 RepID=UPI003F1EB8A4
MIELNALSAKSKVKIVKNANVTLIFGKSGSGKTVELMRAVESYGLKKVMVVNDHGLSPEVSEYFKSKFDISPVQAMDFDEGFAAKVENSQPNVVAVNEGVYDSFKLENILKVAHENSDKFFIVESHMGDTRNEFYMDFNYAPAPGDSPYGTTLEELREAKELNKLKVTVFIEDGWADSFNEFCEEKFSNGENNIILTEDSAINLDGKIYKFNKEIAFSPAVKISW